jgi:alanyl-tRNA synthetase
MAGFPSLTGAEIRSKFLEFYQQRGHKILPSASLVPEDPTVLLTIAGMLPFKPIFLGQKEADFPRATTAQKCIRTNDIENVGRTARHHTFFEMLGNFSFGDYFKEEAIAWGWELVTKVYQLPPEQLVVSVFHSDDRAFEIWRDRIGIPAHRIQRLGEDNFWASGATGPCGPCSEIYFDFKPELGDAKIDLEDDSRFLEIYNLVFMELNRDSEGNLTPLKKQNIDTGLGLERMAQVLQRVPNNYETDLIFPIVQSAAKIAGIDYHTSNLPVQTSLKVIGDHVRSLVHMIADGISASNVGRGYILRRLLRRVVRHGRLLGIVGEFTTEIAEMAIILSETAYPQVRDRGSQIKLELKKEEQRFLQTLERGESLLAEILSNPETKAQKQINGKDAFTLYDTFGFPLELTQEIAEEQGLSVDVIGFERAMTEQQKRSKAAHTEIDLLTQINWADLEKEIGATQFIGYDQLEDEATIKFLVKNSDKLQIVLDKTPFYSESGGQIGDRGILISDHYRIQITDVQKEGNLFIHFGELESESGEIPVVQVGDRLTAEVLVSTRRRTQAHHTATHLLQSALQKLVDSGVSQAGSLVNSDRLRFDFHLGRAVTTAELKLIESQVNNWILEAHNSIITVMPIAEAKAKGAIAMFGEKYGAEVRVIDIPGVSIELCGGTHVKNTAEIGLFKIVSEAGVAAGVRRIEAVSGQAVMDYLEIREEITKELSDRFKVKPEQILERVNNLQAELKNAQKEMESLKQEIALNAAEKLLSQVEQIGKYQILIAELPNLDGDGLKAAAEMLIAKLDRGAVVLGSAPQPDKVNLVAAFSSSANQAGLQAGKLIGAIAKITGGGGGGRSNFAQAGGKDATKLSEALESARSQIHAQISL